MNIKASENIRKQAPGSIILCSESSYTLLVYLMSHNSTTLIPIDFQDTAFFRGFAYSTDIQAFNNIDNLK